MITVLLQNTHFQPPLRMQWPSTKALLAMYKPEQIVFTGDSSGGTLALAAVLSLRDSGIPLPAAVAVILPRHPRYEARL